MTWSGTTWSAGATTPISRSGASWPSDAEHGVLDVGAGTGRVSLRLAARGPPRDRARHRRRAARGAARAGAAKPASRSPRSPPTPPTSRCPRRSASSPCRCRRSSCCPSATASSPRARRALVPGRAARDRDRDRPRALRRRPAAPRPRHRPGGRADLRLAADRDPDRRRRTCRSSGSAQLIGPDGERETFEDVIRLSIVTAGGLAEEAARHGLRGRGAAAHPRDARARRVRGGGLPWLTACASARSIPS